MPPVLLPRSTLEQLEAMLLQPRHAEASTTHGTGPSCGIVIDSLSQLLLRHSTQKVGACFPGPPLMSDTACMPHWVLHCCSHAMASVPIPAAFQ